MSKRRIVLSDDDEEEEGNKLSKGNVEEKAEKSNDRVTTDGNVSKQATVFMPFAFHLLFLKQVDKTATAKSQSTTTSPRETAVRPHMRSLKATPRGHPQVTLILKPRSLEEPHTRWLEMTAVIAPSKAELSVGGVCIGDRTGTNFGAESKKKSGFDETPEGQQSYQINLWKISVRFVSKGDKTLFPRSAFGEDKTVHLWAMCMVFEYLKRLQAGVNEECTALICHNIRERHDVMDCPRGSKLFVEVSKMFKKEWNIKCNDDGEVIRKVHARVPSTTCLGNVRVETTLEEI